MTGDGAPDNAARDPNAGRIWARVSWSGGQVDDPPTLG
jgi:hypothetical protein